MLGFLASVAALIGTDLRMHKTTKLSPMKYSLLWVAIWIAAAAVTLGVIFIGWHWISPASPLTNSEAALAFLAGYVIEYSLSIDNVLLWVLIFTYFAVPAAYQHRVLFWGVVGAIVMRAGMIYAGAALLNTFHWILWVFGGFLMFTAGRMFIEHFNHDKEEIDPNKNWVIRIFKKFVPVTADFEGDSFFTMRNAVRMATPLFIVLLLVETTDLVFAVDSIPAIFAVTNEPILVLVSNVLAIMGLRQLYTVIGGFAAKLHYIKLGLGVVLGFVGVKMLLPDLSERLLGHPYHIPIPLSLFVITVVITLTVVASLQHAKRNPLETPDLQIDPATSHNAAQVGE